MKEPFSLGSIGPFASFGTVSVSGGSLDGKVLLPVGAASLPFAVGVDTWPATAETLSLTLFLLSLSERACSAVVFALRFEKYFCSS